MSIENSIFVYKANVLRVVDGDTIDVLVDLGFGTFRKDRFRFNRIDAFEKTLKHGITEEQKRKGLAGLTFLKEKIEGKEIIIKTFKDSTDKYGRYLAEVFIDGSCLNDIMVNEGYAVYKSYK